VWNWFQNRRYSHRAKTTRVVPSPPAKMTPSGADHHQHAANASAFRAAQPSSVAVAHHGSSSTGKNPMEGVSVEFEAKSARDGAWYDVAAFLSHRLFESGDPEVRVRFSGFGAEEDEWINVRKCVRQRSLPCEATECVAVLPGDLILCFQEDKEQALYFDARVLDAQRRRHDVRGCRCRFLVRYDHDSSEEILFFALFVFGGLDVFVYSFHSFLFRTTSIENGGNTNPHCLCHTRAAPGTGVAEDVDSCIINSLIYSGANKIHGVEITILNINTKYILLFGLLHFLRFFTMYFIRIWTLDLTHVCFGIVNYFNDFYT
ncbi:hypothetical protein ACJX0J_031027, partial [Zea mays]